MGQFLQVNGDYNIKTAEGASITLDTGAGIGDVRVTGNLIVDGDTLTVSTENLQVQDNIITLNYGETGTGVSLIYSGVEVDRGSLDNTAFVYNELDGSWGIANGTVSSGYNFSDSRLKLRYILTDSNVDSGDLTLIGQGTGVIKVLGTVNYEDQVTDDDDIPNRKFVVDAIQNQPARQIISDANTPANPTGTATRVIASDVDAGDRGYDNILVTESEVAIVIDDTPNAFFYIDRAKIQNLTISDYTITADDSNQNISFVTSGTGKLKTNKGLELVTVGSIPASTAGSVHLYSSSAGVGSTGLYFVNTIKNDELISKSKALVFSMIF
jgi:hypothetical protein